MRLGQTWQRGWPLVLVVWGAMLYANSLDGPFIFDDEPNIVLNTRVTNPGQGLRASGWSMVTAGDRDKRPLVTATLALNHALGGLETPVYHLFNIAVHIGAGLALFGLVRVTLLLPRWDRRFDSTAAGWAGAVAAIWMAHPLNTQAVTYVIQRAEAMMAMFFLLAMYAAARQWTANGAGRVGWTGICVGAAWLGTWSKEVMVTLPAVLAAYDWVMLRPGSFAVWLKRRGVMYGGVAAAGAWLVVRTMGGAMEKGSSAGFGMPLVSPFGYLLSQFGVVTHYLRLALWPDVLVLDYFWLPPLLPQTPADQVMKIVLTEIVPYAALIVGLFAASVYGLVGRRWWGFCGIAFFVILAPTSSIMPIADLAFEHRMYLPLTCVVAVVVGTGGVLLRRVMGRQAMMACVALAVVAAAALGSRTFIRNLDYSSAVRICDETIIARPTNPRGWQNLGAALLGEERHDEAIVCFERVLTILPNYAAAHAGLGDIYLAEKQPGPAIAHYRTAIEQDPDQASYHYDLGRALLTLGAWTESTEQLLKAIALQPDYPKAYNNLGLSWLPQDRPTEAIAAFERSIEQNPTQTDAYVNLSITFEKQDDREAARDVMEQAAVHPRDKTLTPEQLEKFNHRLETVRAAGWPAPASP